MKKKILIGAAIVIVGAQFIRIDKTNPPVVEGEDLFSSKPADDKVVQLIHNACFDCHSNETKYPWYTNIAPVSWFIKHHIDEGREHVNFSEWAKYNEKQKSHILEECAEEIEHHAMPLGNYEWMHPEAELSEEDRQLLVDYFEAE